MSALLPVVESTNVAVETHLIERRSQPFQDRDFT
jgi:hypothetical protein